MTEEASYYLQPFLLVARNQKENQKVDRLTEDNKIIAGLPTIHNAEMVCYLTIAM